MVDQLNLNNNKKILKIKFDNYLKNNDTYMKKIGNYSENDSEYDKFVKNKRKLIQIHWIGRFGNRMFQYVFGCHYAYKFGVIYYLPSTWEGTILFEPVDRVKIIPDEKLRLQLNQSLPELDTLKYRTECVEQYNNRSQDNVQLVNFAYKDNFGKVNVCFDDLNMMYFEWIFQSYSSKKIKSFLKFREEIINSPIYQYWYQRRGTYDAAHVRRGDITWKGFTGAHSAISIESYYRAMEKVNIDPKNVIWISDDHNIRTSSHWHQYCRDSWHYPTGQAKIDKVYFDFIPDFLAMIFARNLFRGNSSLSWWAAFLTEGTVYSPVLGDRVTCEGKYFVDCDFVKGNHPHFMGAKWEGELGDIIFGHP